MYRGDARDEPDALHLRGARNLAARQTRAGTVALAECSDGVVFVACAEEPQWQRMVEVMGDPEWAHEEIFKIGWRAETTQTR